MRPRVLGAVVAVLAAAAAVFWVAGGPALIDVGTDGGDAGPGGAGALTPSGSPPPPAATADAGAPPPLAPLTKTDEGVSALERLGGRDRQGDGGVDVARSGETPDGAHGGTTGGGESRPPPPKRPKTRLERYLARLKRQGHDLSMGTVTGRVVRRADGLAVAGAQVRAFPSNRGPDQYVLQVETGEDGRFTLGLPTGEYGVEARAESHAPAMVAGVAVGKDAPTDVGDVVLAHGALVFGTVTGADGTPRAGLTVRAFAVHQGAREVQTDAAGRYRIAGLAPANYFLEVRNPQAPDVFATYVLTLELGEEKQADFGQAEGVDLTVTVLRGGAPLPDAEVRYISRAGTHGDVGLDFADVATGTARTGSTGTVTLPNLTPGPYDLVVSHRDRDAKGKFTGPNRVVVESVTVTPGGTTQQVTVAYSDAALDGQVVEAGTLTPLAGVRVALEPAGLRASRNLADKLIAIGMSYAGTDGQGRFTIAHVPPGEYSASFVKEGYAATVIEQVQIGTTGMHGLRAVLHPGGGAIALAVTVGEARAVQGCFAIVRGPFGADVGLQAIAMNGSAEFKGLRDGLHTVLVFAPNQPVIVREGVRVVAGETTDLAVAVPAPPEAK